MSLGIPPRDAAPAKVAGRFKALDLPGPFRGSGALIVLRKAGQGRRGPVSPPGPGDTGQEAFR